MGFGCDGKDNRKRDNRFQNKLFKYTFFYKVCCRKLNKGDAKGNFADQKEQLIKVPKTEFIRYVDKFALCCSHRHGNIALDSNVWNIPKCLWIK